MKTNFDDFIRTIPGVRIDEKEEIVYLCGSLDCLDRFSFSARDSICYNYLKKFWNNLDESKVNWYLETGYIGDLYVNWKIHFLLCWSGKQEEALDRLRLRAKETYDNLMKGLERNRYFVCFYISSNRGSVVCGSVGIVNATYPNIERMLSAIPKEFSEHAVVTNIIELNELDYNSFSEKDIEDGTKAV